MVGDWFLLHIYCGPQGVLLLDFVVSPEAFPRYLSQALCMVLHAL